MTRITEAITSRSFDSDAHAKVLRNSYVVSADMAHALHPNYESRHDPALSPKFHGGLVIKHNVSNRCRECPVSRQPFYDRWFCMVNTGESEVRHQLHYCSGVP